MTRIITRPIVLTPRQEVIRDMLMEAVNGNRIAQYRVKMEAISTSDFPVAFQQINNAIIQAKLAQYDPQWPAVAKKLTANNLLPSRELVIDMDTTNLPNKNGGYQRIPGSLPRIPEGTEYPGFGFTISKAEYSTAKNGARVAFNWEAFLNDQWNQIQELPTKMVELATNTEETEAFRQYYAYGAGFNGGFFAAGQNLVGNAALTLNSLQAAQAQALVDPATPAGDNPRVNTNSKWALLIPVGLKATATAIMGITQVKQTDVNGTEYLTTPSLGDIVPVVVPWLPQIAGAGNYVQTTGWALVPYGGDGYYGTTVANVGLRGQETPELRIKNDQGQALSGGALSPWDGDFDADAIQIRIRQFIKGVTLNNFGAVWSKGTGSAGTTV